MKSNIKMFFFQGYYFFAEKIDHARDFLHDDPDPDRVSKKKVFFFRIYDSS